MGRPGNEATFCKCDTSTCLVKNSWKELSLALQDFSLLYQGHLLRSLSAMLTMAVVEATRLALFESVVVRPTLKLSGSSTRLSSLMGMLQHSWLPEPAEKVRGLQAAGSGP